MENMKLCQSCAMPLTKTEEIATNQDGTANEDYCIYCFKDGAFTEDMSMEQMIDFCAPFMVKETPGMTEEQAKAQMNAFFPKLKRWEKA